MKFSFYNDTGRLVSIHPATKQYCNYYRDQIEPDDISTFTFPINCDPWMQLWDYGDMGLQILIQSDRKTILTPEQMLDKLGAIAEPRIRFSDVTHKFYLTLDSAELLEHRGSSIFHSPCEHRDTQEETIRATFEPELIINAYI